MAADYIDFSQKQYSIAEFVLHDFCANHRDLDEISTSRSQATSPVSTSYMLVTTIRFGRSLSQFIGSRCIHW